MALPRACTSLVCFRSSCRLRLYNKGAAEWVLARCTNMRNESGGAAAIDAAEREHLMDVITDMASDGLRCIALAFVDFPVHDVKRCAPTVPS